MPCHHSTQSSSWQRVVEDWWLMGNAALGPCEGHAQRVGCTGLQSKYRVTLNQQHIAFYHLAIAIVIPQVNDSEVQLERQIFSLINVCILTVSRLWAILPLIKSEIRKALKAVYVTKWKLTCTGVVPAIGSSPFEQQNDSVGISALIHVDVFCGRFCTNTRARRHWRYWTSPSRRSTCRCPKTTVMPSWRSGRGGRAATGRHTRLSCLETRVRRKKDERIRVSVVTAADRLAPLYSVSVPQWNCSVLFYDHTFLQRHLLFVSGCSLSSDWPGAINTCTTFID